LFRAAEVNELVEAPFFLARTHLEIGRLHGERRKGGAAARHAALAIDIAREYGFVDVERQALNLPATTAAS